MTREILYMLGVVAVGFAVNYALRALPFLLFAGRSRTLPAWVERLGNFLSPVIIAGLILYSYSGLEWKTAWPYLAGALTVGIHLWRRNALASILAGTVAYMLCLNLGCASVPNVSVDAENPSVTVRADGIYFDETRVKPEEVAAILDKAEIPRTTTIHILLDAKAKDLTQARSLMGMLAQAGYTRPVLVTTQHGDSRSKSGRTYAERDLARSSDDVVFAVTKDDVRYGLLTSIGPDDVAKLLAHDRVKKDQQIRIFAAAKDKRKGSVVVARVNQLEGIIRAAGYTNIVRCWLEQNDRTPSSTQGTSAAGHSGSPQKRVRYKGANE